MKNTDYEEIKKITDLAIQIIDDPDSLIERYFNNSLKNLLKFNSKIGTIAHICVYLREIEYLRKIICRFDEPKHLYQWLCEKDFYGKTAIDLASNFDFEEMNNLFEKVIKNEISPKNTEVILKEAILDKYTNIMNGYRQRNVKITSEYLIYSKKDENECVKIPLRELKLEYTEDHKKIKFVNLSNENEYIFKDVNRNALSSWINVLKNIMPNRDRTFYFNAFFYKLLSDLVKETDQNLYEVMKLNENLTYYMSQDKHLPTESSFSSKITEEITKNMSYSNKKDENYLIKEDKPNKKEVNKSEELLIKEDKLNLPANKSDSEIIYDKNKPNLKDQEKKLEELKIKDEKQKEESIEMFSFESEDEDNYKFYEAKE